MVSSHSHKTDVTSREILCGIYSKHRCYAQRLSWTIVISAYKTTKEGPLKFAEDSTMNMTLQTSILQQGHRRVCTIEIVPVRFRLIMLSYTK